MSQIDSDKITERSVADLIHAIKGEDRYVFLIGAGTSRAAGIPTVSKLVEKWRKEKFQREAESEGKEFDGWVENQEDKMSEEYSEYGFWFEQAHPSKGQRRDFIRDLVEDKEPTFGIIALAAIMSEGYVPVTLTPNFDDLLYDSFYLFLEEKPFLINHNALALQFKITEDRPTIVKLHGDYLFDNIKNIKGDRKYLKENMKNVLKKCLTEYGLVVVGYGGNDESIINPICEKIEEPASCIHGLWWCKYKRSELSENAKEILQKRNAFLVEIDSSEELFFNLWNKLDIDKPKMDELEKQYEKRKDKWRRARQKFKENPNIGEEKKESFEEYDNIQNKMEKATDLYNQNKYDEAEKYLRQILEIDSEYINAHNNLGVIFDEREQYDDAEKHYRQALEIDPEYKQAHLSLGSLFVKKDEYDKAENHYQQALEINPEDVTTIQNLSELKIIIGDFKESYDLSQKALNLSNNLNEKSISLMLLSISKEMLGKEYSDELDELKELCKKEFESTLSFEELDTWLEDADLSDEKEQNIKEIMDLVRAHKTD
ncbi:MAG: tetratricopeptide repeat protein [archaeon]